MDHLPVQSDIAVASIMKVQYLELLQYDQKGFYGYPERIGIRETDIINFQHDDDSKHWKLSCLHEFSETWNIPLDLSSFVETDNTGAPFITTRPLIHLAP